MKKTIFIAITFITLLVTAGYSQTNLNLGEEYFYIGNYNDAEAFFKKQLSQNPAQSYYYLGEIAFARGDLAGAKANYEKGLQAAPDDLYNQIGLVKINYSADPKNNLNALKKIAKKSKKDAKVWCAVAYVLMHNNDKANAWKIATEDAQKAEYDKKKNYNSPLPYICQGDIAFIMDKDISLATDGFKTALYYDSLNVIASYKQAEVYNYTQTGVEPAIAYLTKVINARPDFLPAYEQLAPLYYLTGNYPKTVESFEKYINAPNADPSANEYSDYTGAYLWMSQGAEDTGTKYEYLTKASEIVREGIQKYPNDFYLNRMLMYVAAESKNYDNAALAGDKLFAIKKADSKVRLDDYTVYAQALAQCDPPRTQEAVKVYKDALQFMLDQDPENLQAYKAIAEQFYLMKLYGEAADMQKQYINAMLEEEEEIPSFDYYRLAQSYYYAGSPTMIKSVSDSTITAAEIAKAKSLLLEADKYYVEVIKLDSVSPIGYAGRAKTNSALDPKTETGLAKPYYEKLIEKSLAYNNGIDPTSPEFKNIPELKEAYTYLSVYYYYKMVDAANAKDSKAEAASKASGLDYCNKLLAIDPANGTATQLLGIFNPAPAPAPAKKQ